MINEFFEKVFEVTSSVFNFAVDFFRSPIKTIYPCLKALSDKWYEFQRWFVGLFPTDEQGRSYSTNFVLFFVTISLFSCLFRPWRWDMVAKKIPPSAGGTIAILEIISRWVCAYVGFLGDPFTQIFLWSEAYFKNPAVISGFTSFGSHLLADYGVFSLGLGFLVKCITALGAFILSTVKIPLSWMIFFKTAVLGISTCLKIFEILVDINGVFELLPNIQVFKNEISASISEFVNSYFEWWPFFRVLRVETGREDEEPIEIKTLKKGENEGHKIVLGGSRIDGMRLFGIHLREYNSILAMANLRFWSWFTYAYGTGKILCF